VNDDSVTIGSSTDGDLVISSAGDGSVELNGIANNNGIDSLAELANVITIEFG
jgi:hypothetical protein